MNRSKHPVLLVFSGGLTKRGNLPFFVRNKLDHAYKLYHRNIAKKIIVSGKSSLFIDEKQKHTDAEAMKRYLILLGVEEKAILTEEESKDLISGVYFTKTRILLPKNISHLYILGSDFEDERIMFVCNKILGPEFSIQYEFVHSQIRSEVLWDFFSYEREILVNTKAFLRKMKRGDHQFLSHKFFDSPFYKEHKIGFIREQVFNGHIGRRRSAKAHYALPKILAKRKEIFAQYNLHLLPQRTLMAGWWSGGFLNFLGQGDDASKYSLKFPLYLKDRQNLIREITMINALNAHGSPFVPKIVGQNISESPYWYMYKVIPGSMAGNFGALFSFHKRFLTKPHAATLINYLQEIRSIKIKDIEMTVWRTKKYTHRMKDVISKYRKHPLLDNPTIQNAIKIFKKNVSRFDDVHLVTSHNDLHPANILIGSDQKVYIIDFGLAGLNNIAFDFGLMYLFAWNSPYFQNELKMLFIESLTQKQKKEFEYIFPYLQLYLHVWLLEYTARFEVTVDKEIIQPTRQTLLNSLENIISNLS